MTTYLLDTNTISDLVRNPGGRVTAHLAERQKDIVCTSIIVAAELKFGVARRMSTRLHRQVSAILADMDILPFEAPADSLYAELRADLEREGRLIGANDMLIAAHALALRATLVTANVREFSRVPSLRLENWLR